MPAIATVTMDGWLVGVDVVLRLRACPPEQPPPTCRRVTIPPSERAYTNDALSCLRRRCRPRRRNETRRRAVLPGVLPLLRSLPRIVLVLKVGHIPIRHDTMRPERYDTIRYDTIRYDTIRYDTSRMTTRHVTSRDATSRRARRRGARGAGALSGGAKGRCGPVRSFSSQEAHTRRGCGPDARATQRHLFAGRRDYPFDD